MDAAWYKALHLIGLFFWIGSALLLSRYMKVVVKEQSLEARRAMLEYAKRTYNFIGLPGFAASILFGALLLFGIGIDGMAVGDYLMPRVEGTEGSDGRELKSLWYVSFHLKLVLVSIFIGLDQWLGAKIRKLNKNPEADVSPVSFSIVHGLMGLIVVINVLLMVAGVLKGQ